MGDFSPSALRLGHLEHLGHIVCHSRLSRLGQVYEEEAKNRAVQSIWPLSHFLANSKIGAVAVFGNWG
jgi:hypothetical protein